MPLFSHFLAFGEQRSGAFNLTGVFGFRTFAFGFEQGTALGLRSGQLLHRHAVRDELARLVDHSADQRHQQNEKQREQDPLARRVAQGDIDDEVDGDRQGETGKGGGQGDEHERAGADQPDCSVSTSSRVSSGLPE
ncbi:hypothetical protein HFP57_00010 [Parasphingopyxis algicola]|uniref:hypothetical protein n=1 Tax=Parasphingopyxis algicola TaxID=2026624 RepID=UPI0015A447FD|nr:hypothetical protein [Parasphingopyxis algicola]QLC26722.1 hypothetical protein HFP57_00010 [Parasphingopyxis algicola]